MQSLFAIVKTRWELKKKTSHMRVQRVSDVPKIAHKRFGADKPLYIRYEFRNFDGALPHG